MSLLIVLTLAPIDLSTAKTECPSINAFFRAMTENDNGGRLVISYSNSSNISSLDPRPSCLRRSMKGSLKRRICSALTMGLYNGPPTPATLSQCSSSAPKFPAYCSGFPRQLFSHTRCTGVTLRAIASEWATLWKWHFGRAASVVH
jgi:hypothetical protein